MSGESQKNSFEFFYDQVEMEAGDGVEGILNAGLQENLNLEFEQMSLDFREPGPHFSEVQGWLTKDDLEEVKKDFVAMETDDMSGAMFFAKRAADLKEFDPDWFFENITLTSSQRIDLAKGAKLIESHPLKYLEYLEDLKIFSPEVFEKIEIKPEVWQKVCAKIMNQIQNPAQFLQNYGRAVYIDVKQTHSLIEIEKYWDALAASLNSAPSKNVDNAEAISYAQILQPKDGIKVRFESTDWLSAQRSIIGELNTYRNGGKVFNLKNFLAGARAVKYLQLDDYSPKK